MRRYLRATVVEGLSLKIDIDDGLLGLNLVVHGPDQSP